MQAGGHREGGSYRSQREELDGSAPLFVGPSGTVVLPDTVASLDMLPNGTVSSFFSGFFRACLSKTESALL